MRQCHSGSRLRGVLNLTQMDAATQADVAALAPGAAAGVPCGVPGAATTKCEACEGACQPWSVPNRIFKGNERTHYTVPPAGANATRDVLLYRDNEQTILYASVRDGGDWSEPAATDIPNDKSNINAGALPDGRRYLVSNAMPFTIRDPLVIATSSDGRDFDKAQVAMSCTRMPPGTDCKARYAGKAKNPGPSYPQAVAVPELDAVFVVATNNKEDVVVARLPLASL